MDTFLMIVGIHAVLFGFAFLFGGFMTIAAPSTVETEELRRAWEAARARSWFHGQLEALRQASRAKGRGIALFIVHWPERPQGRKLMYAGAICLAIAAAVGYHLGVFAS
jgi:hypothetical protein